MSPSQKLFFLVALLCHHCFLARADVEECLSDVDDELERARDELADLNIAYTEQEEFVSGICTQIEELETDIQSLQDTCDSLEDDVENANDNFDDATDVMEDAEGEVEEAEAEVEAALEDLAIAEDIVAEIEALNILCFNIFPGPG